MKFRNWLELSAFLVVVFAFGLFAWVPEIPAHAEVLMVENLPEATPECPYPQIIEVEDPLEIPLGDLVLWGKLEDPKPYLKVARENCLLVVLTETPSGAKWFWIPSWDSRDEKQEILDLFRDADLDVPWPLSGPHSISIPSGSRPGSSP